MYDGSYIQTSSAQTNCNKAFLVVFFYIGRSFDFFMSSVTDIGASIFKACGSLVLLKWIPYSFVIVHQSLVHLKKTFNCAGGE